MAEPLVGEPGRLDAVIARLMDVPRADVQRAIEAGLVLVDGTVKTKSHRLLGGERLSVRLLMTEALLPGGEPVPVRLEDEHLLVIAKPAGLPTHPTAARQTGTLVNSLMAMGVPLAPAGGALRPGIVHRLDAGTSGLLVVAKTDEAFTKLQAMFRARSVVRRYVALVRGAPAHDVFTVGAARPARIVVDRLEGRAASTDVHVRERFARSALLDVAPRTGRTHQIRVHLAAVGHPVLGDRAYGGSGDDARELGLSRPFLHAARISFVHPVTGEAIDLQEPLPGDLVDALNRARSDLRR
ncbi:MAG: RluA family pseudouridine synthase [Actinomycetota bacterium]